MAKMKTESVEFTTEKSLQQIVAILRQATSELKATMETVDSGGDALSKFDGPTDSDIQVVLSGRLGCIGGLKHPRMGSMQNDWAVQVYVDDMGTARHVQLVALGQSVFVDCHGALNMGGSRERQEYLANALR